MASPSIHNDVYDAALAQKLGGDDYGMKKYVLVLLKTSLDLMFHSREHQKSAPISRPADASA